MIDILIEIVLEILFEFFWGIMSLIRQKISSFFYRVPKRWDRLEDEKKGKLINMRKKKKQNLENKLNK